MTPGIAAEEIKWFGIVRPDGTISYFKDTGQDYVEIFNSLRRGIIPEIAGEEQKIPDLRYALINFGKSRLREELGEDRFAVKLFQVLSSTDEIINLYYEKASGFSIFVQNENNESSMKDTFNAISSGDTRFDGEALRVIGAEGLRLLKLRKDLTDRLNELILRIMPNTSKLIGGGLASELLSRAGSLQRLALFSASAIQLTGAERSLFQHISRGTDPPKHGVIYKHSLVAGAPDGKTGRRARRLACKICITARADMRGTLLADELIQKYIAEIQRE
jgi:nucleolar protein 56